MNERLRSHKSVARRWVFFSLCCYVTAAAAGPTTAMLGPADDSGWEVVPLFTVGETIGGYQPPGILDGIVALPGAPGAVRVYVTHELESGAGYPYTLANGTRLTGSRLTRFDLDSRSGQVRGAVPAFGEVRDRQGREVTRPVQVNEQRDGGGLRGLDSFCSAAGYGAGTHGFTDEVIFLNEESTVEQDHAHGGSVWALDVQSAVLWALPALGRGSWENVTALDAPPGKVALLLGDDYEFGQAPLYLWLGEKVAGGNFPERNGLVRGQLSVWVADNGDRSPQQWHGTGSRRAGRFVPIAARDPAAAGKRDHDSEGYLNDSAMRRRARELGAFMFSRPEDLHTNPRNGRQAVFASTGFGFAFPRDDWGDLILIEVNWPDAGGEPRADLSLLYDSDDTRDEGIRSPDNLTWARDGFIYVQEDKATKVGAFGQVSGREASIWRLDPARPREPRRVAQVLRSAVPAGMTDSKAAEFGAWESSGIADVSALMNAEAGEVILLADVQAHGVRDGAIGGNSRLVEAGQLLMLRRKASPPEER